MKIAHQHVQGDPEQGRRVAILGFGEEGKAVLRFLKKNQPKIKPVILDKKRDSKYLSRLKDFDLIYRSPGVPYTLPKIQEAIKSGVNFSSATDLFFKSVSQRSKGTIIGITGTTGKSTVSTLIYKILKAAGRDVYLGGNIGKPAIELLPKLKKNSITVLELSSFQLQDLKHSPQIAIILDVFPDHLDIHQSLDEYIKAKSQITRSQTTKDAVFYFSNNKQAKAMASKSRGKKIPVSPDVPIPEIKILGPHNRKNIAMVMAVAKHFKVPQKNILKTLKTFGGLPHRLKIVRSIKGVKFYNDSASTNPETTAAAIMSFRGQPKILIMGGKDKGLDYEPVAEAAYMEEVKLVVLFGENKKKIGLALDKIVKTKTAGSLESAVNLAYKEARKLLNLPRRVPTEQRGKKTHALINVIFSPGAASFDMFENYKSRGKTFSKIVKSLK